MNKKNISFILLVIISIIFLYGTSFAEEKEKTNTYKDYKKNVKEHCLQATFYTENNNGNKYIYKYEEYQKYYPSAEEIGSNSKTKYLENEENFALKAIKEIYRNTQNEIYRCGIISAEFKGMRMVEESVKLDKTGMLKNLIDNKLKPRIERLKNTNKQCKFENDDLNISKKQILDQSTFELCKYIFYLGYLEGYYSSIDKSLGTDKIKKGYDTQYRPDFIAGLQEKTKAEIQNEIEHSSEIYGIAFGTYSQFENYYPIHISLELLKDSLRLYREQLYKALSPINQTVYKVINAMSE